MQFITNLPLRYEGIMWNILHREACQNNIVTLCIKVEHNKE